jgi:hypothetical protein
MKIQALNTMYRKKNQAFPFSFKKVELDALWEKHADSKQKVSASTVQNAQSSFACSVNDPKLPIKLYRPYSRGAFRNRG